MSDINALVTIAHSLALVTRNELPKTPMPLRPFPSPIASLTYQMENTCQGRRYGKSSFSLHSIHVLYNISTFKPAR